VLHDVFFTGGFLVLEVALFFLILHKIKGLFFRDVHPIRKIHRLIERVQLWTENEFITLLLFVGLGFIIISLILKIINCFTSIPL